MALLDEIGHGQAVMAESGGERNHQPHMGGRQLVERGFIPLFLPSHGQQALLLPFEEWSIHRGSYEPTANP
jgi:hypothetical protein